MKPLTLCTLLIALAWSGVPAMASTPDGMTPATEDVCDKLIGMTPGLYGLCVAYCEAQDCDVEAAHSGQCTRNPPNEPVLSNYNRKMQPGDPAMPCLAPPPSACPCWTDEEVTNIQVTSCRLREDNVLIVKGSMNETVSISEQICTLDERQSPLDAEQLEACTNSLDQSISNSGIICTD